jgi:hypothetical protein
MNTLSLAVIASSALFTLSAHHAAAADTDNMDGSQLIWQAITFGQSTDLNFGSGVLPEKVGTNEVLVDGKAAQPGPLADSFTIESRGGKIANSHEGLTFYYTRLPAGVNFTLAATVILEQLGPETGSSPNQQEGAGLMVRDIIGSPRLDPQPAGLEEFPAASNMVMNLLRANKKGESNGLVDVTATYREGIYEPWGTAGNRMGRDALHSGVAFGPEHNYRMTLARTDTGFEVGYNGQIQAVKGANANIVQMQDPGHQYVGFFASRNARVKVSDVSIELSPANTVEAPRYQAQQEKVVLEPASPAQSATEAYTVQARANYGGVFSLQQDGNPLVEYRQVAAGEMFRFDARLLRDKTDFALVYTPVEGPDLSPLTHSYSVTRVGVSDPMNLVVNPDGSKGRMTLAEAVGLLPPGGTISLEEGDYEGITIPATASGTAEHRKSLRAQGQVRFTGDIIHKASYWDIADLEVAGARMIVHGSHNRFDRIKTHSAEDTGFQITSPEGLGRTLWASHNRVADSESFNNMDPSRINADGFAAKMRVGDGNTFIRCIAHHNIDDGWDLFNKVEDGPNGAVTILDSVSYLNGRTLTVVPEGGAQGNGFKLGGEGLPVAHVIKNSLAFHNLMDGFTDNFNPGSLTVENNVAIDNQRFNFLFRKSPYADTVQQGSFVNNRSYRFAVDSDYDDVVNGEQLTDNHFLVAGDEGVHADNIVSLRHAAILSGEVEDPGRHAVERILHTLDMRP